MEDEKVLLSSAYFGPVQWYQKLYRYGEVWLEQHDSFLKQTYRNRCVIATANGVQALTVPVVNNPFSSPTTHHPPPTKDIRISDHGNWRHLHWQALTSAYGDSPFFEYYADDLRPFFERRWTFLFDFNLEITHKMCELLDIHPVIHVTEEYQRTGRDFREAIRPKHPLPDNEFHPRPYYQVYAQRHGFLPNLSILDLLFNMGNESIFYL